MAKTCKKRGCKMSGMMATPNENFCSQCGNRLVEMILQKCKNCGRNLLTRDKFCGHCGTPVHAV
jgi:uncharacterized OB-fold protein